MMLTRYANSMLGVYMITRVVMLHSEKIKNIVSPLSVVRWLKAYAVLGGCIAGSKVLLALYVRLHQTSYLHRHYQRLLLLQRLPRYI